MLMTCLHFVIFTRMYLFSLHTVERKFVLSSSICFAFAISQLHFIHGMYFQWVNGKVHLFSSKWFSPICTFFRTVFSMREKIFKRILVIWCFLFRQLWPSTWACSSSRIWAIGWSFAECAHSSFTSSCSTPSPSSTSPPSSSSWASVRYVRLISRRRIFRNLNVSPPETLLLFWRKLSCFFAVSFWQIETR